MNDRTDLDRVVADWLTAEAQGPAPGRILSAAATRIDHTSQRRGARWPWQLGVATPLARVAGVALVVTVIAVGTLLLGRLQPPSGVGGASPSPTGSTEFSPRPAQPGPLTPGVSYSFELPVSVSFSAPAGWVYGSTGPNGSTIVNDRQTAAVGWFAVDNLYRDPCHWLQGTLTPPVGAGVDAMVTALRNMPGFDVTGPTATSIGGLPAQSLTLDAKASDATCDGGQTKVWSWTPTGNQLPLYGGTSIVVVVDVAGRRVLVTSWAAQSDPGAAADATAIIGTTRFR